MKEIGNITKASINQRNGCMIKFTTKENVTEGSILAMSYTDDSSHYFEAESVEMGDDNDLLVEAKEVGYWARLFSRREAFDVRTLAGIPVRLITDEKSLRSINEMRCWC